MAVSCLTPSQLEGTPGGALWFTNSGEQISSKASMLPLLCTSSTKRRTRALFCSADMLFVLLVRSFPRAPAPQHMMLQAITRRELPRSSILDLLYMRSSEKASKSAQSPTPIGLLCRPPYFVFGTSVPSRGFQARPSG